MRSFIWGILIGSWLTVAMSYIFVNNINTAQFFAFSCVTITPCAVAEYLYMINKVE